MKTSPWLDDRLFLSTDACNTGTGGGGISAGSTFTTPPPVLFFACLATTLTFWNCLLSWSCWNPGVSPFCVAKALFCNATMRTAYNLQSISTVHAFLAWFSAREKFGFSPVVMTSSHRCSSHCWTGISVHHVRFSALLNRWHTQRTGFLFPSTVRVRNWLLILPVSLASPLISSLDFRVTDSSMAARFTCVFQCLFYICYQHTWFTTFSSSYFLLIHTFKLISFTISLGRYFVILVSNK